MEARIHGPADPSGVSVSDALRMLAAIERSLRACADDEAACLALVGVSQGSVVYHVTMSRITPIATALFTMATLSGSYGTLPTAARTALRDCLKVVTERAWTVAIRWQDGDAEPATILSRDTPPVPDDEATMIVATTLYGIVERIGGREPRIVFRLDDGQAVSCPVSVEEACRWSGHLYQTVCITGDAVVRVDDQQIVDLRLGSVSPFDPQPIAQTMRELATLVGADLGRDAIALLYESRGDDSEAA
jgi:hypothetical protein